MIALGAALRSFESEGLETTQGRRIQDLSGSYVGDWYGLGRLRETWPETSRSKDVVCQVSSMLAYRLFIEAGISGLQEGLAVLETWEAPERSRQREQQKVQRKTGLFVS